MARPAEIGTIKIIKGPLIICDAYVPEEKWQSMSSCSSSWAVDFTPKRPKDPKDVEQTEHLAHLERSYDVVTLADGTLRVVVPDQQVARIIEDHANRLLIREDYRVTLRVHPVRASKDTAKDVTRESGVGMVTASDATVIAIAARPGQRFEVVEIRDTAGKLSEVRIKIPQIQEG